MSATLKVTTFTNLLIHIHGFLRLLLSENLSASFIPHTALTGGNRPLVHILLLRGALRSPPAGPRLEKADVAPSDGEKPDWPTGSAKRGGRR